MNDIIPGIFNYCDRWCDRCNYTNRCTLFISESQIEVDLILSDEDINDPNVYSKIVSGSLRKSFDKLINEEDENNIEDLFQSDEEEHFCFDDSECDEVESSEDLSITDVTHPLIDMTNVFYQKVSLLYEKIQTAYGSTSEKNQKSNPFSEDFETLLWYSPQINVKTRICFWSLNIMKKESLNEFENETLNVNSRIAYIGVSRCIKTLQKLINEETDFNEDFLNLLGIIFQIKDAFIEIFPDSPAYRRPYFD